MKRLAPLLLGLTLACMPENKHFSGSSKPYEENVLYSSLYLSSHNPQDIKKIAVPAQFYKQASLVVEKDYTYVLDFRSDTLEIDAHTILSFDEAKEFSKHFHMENDSIIERFATQNSRYVLQCSCFNKKSLVDLMEQFQEDGYTTVATLRYDSVPGIYVSPRRAPKKMWTTYTSF